MVLLELDDKYYLKRSKRESYCTTNTDAFLTSNNSTTFKLNDAKYDNSLYYSHRKSILNLLEKSSFQNQNDWWLDTEYLKSLRSRETSDKTYIYGYLSCSTLKRINNVTVSQIVLQIVSIENSHQSRFLIGRSSDKIGLMGVVLTEIESWNIQASVEVCIVNQPVMFPGKRFDVNYLSLHEKLQNHYEMLFEEILQMFRLYEVPKLCENNMMNWIEDCINKQIYTRYGKSFESLKGYKLFNLKLLKSGSPSNLLKSWLVDLHQLLTNYESLHLLLFDKSRKNNIVEKINDLKLPQKIHKIFKYYIVLTGSLTGILNEIEKYGDYITKELLINFEEELEEYKKDA